MTDQEIQRVAALVVEQLRPMLADLIHDVIHRATHDTDELRKNTIVTAPAMGGQNRG